MMNVGKRFCPPELTTELVKRWAHDHMVLCGGDVCLVWKVKGSDYAALGSCIGYERADDYMREIGVRGDDCEFQYIVRKGEC